MRATSHHPTFNLRRESFGCCCCSAGLEFLSSFDRLRETDYLPSSQGLSLFYSSFFFIHPREEFTGMDRAFWNAHVRSFISGGYLPTLCVSL